MDDIQKLIWFGRVLSGSAPPEQKEIAKREIDRLLGVIDEPDWCHQFVGLLAVKGRLLETGTRRSAT